MPEPMVPKEEAQRQALATLADVYGADLNDAARKAAIDSAGGGWQKAVGMALSGLGQAASRGYGRGMATNAAAPLIQAEKDKAAAQFDENRKFALQQYMDQKLAEREAERIKSQREFQAGEAQKQREFQASEGAKTRQTQYDLAAATKAATNQEKKDKLYVPSLGQYALSEQDAKDAKAATTLAKQFKAKVQDMIDIRKQAGLGGGEFWNREMVDRGKQISNDVLILYKDLAKLGVMSKSDEELLRRIIPADPTEWSPLRSIRGDSVMAKLDGLIKDIDRNQNIFLMERGFDPRVRHMPGQADPGFVDPDRAELEARRAMQAQGAKARSKEDRLARMTFTPDNQTPEGLAAWPKQGGGGKL